MLPIERRGAILDQLQRDKRVVVGELIEQFGVSDETIRRDLARLEKDGFAIKSYGGAVLAENDGVEWPFDVRKNHNVEQKRKVAELVSRLVRDGDRLFLDASSTAVFVTRALAEKKKLTIVTNSIEITLSLLMRNDWMVVSTGGNANAGSYALTGPATNQMIACRHADKAIISCKGLSMDNGVTDGDENHAVNKRTMLGSSSYRILAADGGKFGEVAYSKVCDFSGINMIVTDRDPGGEWKEFLGKAGVEIVWE
ncbi:MAG: DeoR/GlpR family DNA-binding transcription regulator [Clostridiales bacterium]|jgi:DeoR/GlpR family transcriptional regulator of sugar metabolism|nr:DeoR/GlpR family DNA-binding transcription regulator [Clostridiales bacterium]